MALFLDGRFLVQLLLAGTLGEQIPSRRRHIQKHLQRSRGRASAARERTAFFNTAETIQRPFSCRPLQISDVAAASTTPVDQRSRAGKNLESHSGFLVHLQPPAYTRTVCALAVIRPAAGSKWKYLPTRRRTFNAGWFAIGNPGSPVGPRPRSVIGPAESAIGGRDGWRRGWAKLATMAMIAVCPQLNPIPVPTRKKPNSDQPA